MNTTPAGYHAVTPSLTIKGASQAIEFYQRAFGATELYCIAAPDGTVLHAEIKLGDSIVMLSDEFPSWGALSPATIGGCPSTLRVFVPDVDSAFQQAVAAGATPTMPVSTQFWGDRTGSLLDPYGYKWSLATRIEDLSPEEILLRFSAWTQTQQSDTP